MTGAHKLVLGIHPTARGFGWALLGEPDTILDWGVASAKATRKSRSMARFKRLLHRYHPHSVVFEEFEGWPMRRSARIEALCRAMIHEAHVHHIGAFVYSRQTIHAVLSTARTRHEIAQAVAERLHPLRRTLPRKRRAWNSTDERQCIFDAAAAALAHYAPDMR